jgi:hypothetical protein
VVFSAAFALTDHRAAVGAHALGIALVLGGMRLVFNFAHRGMALAANRAGSNEIMSFGGLAVVKYIFQFYRFSAAFREVLKVRHLPLHSVTRWSY